MAIPLTINGITYQYPVNQDEGWGPDATKWAVAITQGTLQKSGGLFTLTADVDFGAAFGIKSLYYKTRSSSIATAGNFRLANTDLIVYRNAANSGNLNFGAGSSDAIPAWNGVDLVNLTATQTLSNKTFVAPIISGNLNVTGNIIAIGTITGSNLSGTNTGDVTLGTANGLSLVGQVLSLGLSSTSTTGALSSTDWNTFNNKQSALTFGSISTSTIGVTVGSGSNSTVGPNVTVNIQTADATHNGLLSSTDWTTFNSKQPAGSYVTSVTASSPLASSGGATPNLSIQVANASQNGYLSSTDWTTFNSKQAAGSYITALTGDVTASGPGSSAAVVAFVGTSSAANVHSAELLANASTALNTASTIVRRDASGNFSAGIITATLSGNATNVTGVVAIANGGTGQSTANAGFNALSPMTTLGDVIIGGASGAGTRLPIGSSGQILTVVSGSPAWAPGGSGSGDISNGGNTFGSNITIGTNDAFNLNFETNNVSRFTVNQSDQLLSVNGGAAALPAFSFTGSPTIGMFRISSTSGGLAQGGNTYVEWGNSLTKIQNFPLSVINGLVGSPSFTFTSDTSTGIYRGGAGITAFSSSGVNVFNVESARVSSNVPFRGVTSDTAAAPTYSWNTDTNTGIYHGGTGVISLTSSGSDILITSSTNVRPLVPIYSTDGSVSNPSYSFNSDSDTGIYRTGSGIMAFASNGTSVLTVEPTQIHATQAIQAIGGTVSAVAINFGFAGTGFYANGSSTAVLFSSSGVDTFEMNAGNTRSLVPFYSLNGSAAAPSYAFALSTDTGIYRFAAGSLGFSTSGVAAGNIDGSQKWTIGQTASTQTHLLQGSIEHKDSGGTSYIQDPLKSLALVNNTTANVFSIAAASNQSVVIDYRVIRNTAYETGTITIITDTATAQAAVASVSINSSGVTFAASISGANLILSYTTDNSGSAGTLTYAARRW